MKKCEVCKIDEATAFYEGLEVCNDCFLRIKDKAISEDILKSKIKIKIWRKKYLESF